MVEIIVETHLISWITHTHLTSHSLSHCTP